MLTPARRNAIKVSDHALRAGRIAKGQYLRYIPSSGHATYSTRKSTAAGGGSGPRYNFNTSMSWDAEPDPDHPRYRRVTARDLKHRSEPPTRVKMLVRDFIDDSLYNPNYGYFSKQAQIFSPTPIPSSSQTPSSPSTPIPNSTSPLPLSPSSTPPPPPIRGFPISTFPNLTAFQEYVAEAYDREYAVQVETQGQGRAERVTAIKEGQTGSGQTSLRRNKRRGASSSTTEIDHISTSSTTPPTSTSTSTTTSSSFTNIQVGQRERGPVIPGGLGRQVWHTPTELFKPHYSRIIARALLAHYKLHHYPHNPFHIYELGAGNGSLMIDIMTFLKEEHPEVFAMTRYTIVEISEQLAERQRGRAREAGFLVEGERVGEVGQDKGKGKAKDRQERRGGTVEVINKDWFEWEGGGDESCYAVALEVLDNFAHDMIRYDLRTMEPLQAVVCIDNYGDFSLLYEPIADPLIRRYLAYRHLLHASSNASIFTSNSVSPPVNPLLLSSPTLRKLYASLPFAPNLSDPEFVPTKQMLFLESLRDKLPHHRLLAADFDSLPDTVPGRNGPVVQTRYGGSMVPCETFLVKQGFFDIFFPTDFKLLRDIYTSIMMMPSRKLSPSFFSSSKAQGSKDMDGLQGVKGFKHQNVSVFTHSGFLEEFGTKKDIEATRTKDGGNVMLGMYKNAKFLF